MINLLRLLTEEEDPTLEGVVSDLPGGGWNQAAAEASLAPKPSRMNTILDSILAPQPTGPATQAYLDHISNMPERQDRSGLAKVIAALSGAFVGPEKALSALDAPNRRNMEDFRNRASMLAEPARLEQQGMMQRNRLGATAADIVRKDEYGNALLDERERHNKEVENIQGQDLERKRTEDQSEAQHRNRMGGVAERRASLESQRTADNTRLTDARVEEIKAKEKLALAKTDPKAAEDIKRETANNLRAANSDPELAKYFRWERGNYIRDWPKLAKLDEAQRRAFEAKYRSLVTGKPQLVSLNEDGESEYEDLEEDLDQ